jgi:hypothetical protein
MFFVTHLPVGFLFRATSAGSGVEGAFFTFWTRGGN